MNSVRHSQGICVFIIALLLAAVAPGRALAAGAVPSRNNADDSASSQVERNGQLITPPVLRPGEGLAKPPIGGLIAYSLKAAQARLSGFGSNDNWRRRDPELFTLGGITRPVGLVVDRASGDVILIGQAQEGDAPLTLDDLVVALRARLIEGKWPLVSIDPVPGVPVRQGDPQKVRFEGGIKNTQFGADLLDADHRLKRMAFGLLPSGAPNLVSYFERSGQDNNSSKVTIGSRFWFEPAQDRVVVRDGVVQLGPMSVSVFTEVLSVSIEGKPIDPRTYHDNVGDAFASDISANFDDVAHVHPTIARVRGLNAIVAVVAGIERIDNMPSLDFWLSDYVVRTIKTPATITALRRTGQFHHGSMVSSVELQGGVQLRAIPLALQTGDVSDLRRAVLAARRDLGAVSWRLILGQWIIPLTPGALPPSALTALYAQEAFLSQQRRWDDAIAVMDAALRLLQSNPEGQIYLASAFVLRGEEYANKGRYDTAIQDFTEAIRLDQNSAEAFINRGAAYILKGQFDRGIEDLNHAIRLEPNAAFAFNNRSAAYRRERRYDLSILDADQAIRLAPKLAVAFFNRGSSYYSKGQIDRAMNDFDQAIQLATDDSETLADALSGRGTFYMDRHQYDRAIEEFDKAIAAAPNLAYLFCNRGQAFAAKGQHDRAINDYDTAIRLDRTVGWAFALRGNSYVRKGQYDRAIKDYNEAIKIDPNDPELLYNRGTILRVAGQPARAAADFARAKQIKPDIGQPP